MVSTSFQLRTIPREPRAVPTPSLSAHSAMSIALRSRLRWAKKEICCAGVSVLALVEHFEKATRSRARCRRSSPCRATSRRCSAESAPTHSAASAAERHASGIDSLTDSVRSACVAW
eukprot:6195784-Pleurochrysis_carterae.AAC.4